MKSGMKRSAVFFLGLLMLGMQANAAEFLVKMASHQHLFSINNVNTVAGVKILDRHTPGLLEKVWVNADAGSAEEGKILANLRSRGDVEYVVPNAKLHAFSAPLEGKALQEQWAIGKINAQKAWERAGNKGSRQVVVAVIDTGMDYKHEALKLNAVPGFNFKDNNDDPMDITGDRNPGHGTHCSGIIGASGLTENGTVGISPEVSIMPLRFLGEDGSGDLQSAIKALDYAIDKKVQVVSASWGAAISADNAKPLIEAVKRVSDAGIIFVAAAANDGKDNDQVEMYPANARFDNTITVAASGPDDEKPSWSNYGIANVALASPGLKIQSTLPGDKYGPLSGTSMATPLVAGLVAFLKAQDSSLTGAQIRALLQSTGAKVEIATACKCRIDAFAATDALKNKSPWLVPAATTLAVGATQSFAMMNASGAMTFAVSDAEKATIGNDGMLKATAAGDVTVTATDSAGKKAQSVAIHIGGASPNDGNHGGNGNGGGGNGGGGNGGQQQCPIADPKQCETLCQSNPAFPWCHH